MNLDSGSVFVVLTIVTAALLTCEWAARRFTRREHMTAGHVANTLAWIAGSEVVIAIVYAAPFPAPAKPGVWIFPLAALVTFLMAVGVGTMDVRRPTPAVQRSRARRQSR